MAFDPRRLQVLAAIAEAGSLSRAAQSLTLSQPAVSRQLAALEREVGVELVSRGPRRATLTLAGEALMEETARIQTVLDSAERRLGTFTGAEGGAVRLAAVPSALSSVVPAALEALRAARPRVQVELREGWSSELAGLIRHGETDLAVIAVGAEDEVPRSDLLLHERFAALLPASHRLASHRKLALSDLAEEHWILAPEPGGRHTVLAACAAAGFAPRQVATAGWEATAELIAVGIGVALVPEATGARLCRHPGLVAIRLSDVPPRKLRLLRAQARQSAVERDLERHLCGAAKGAGSEIASRP